MILFGDGAGGKCFLCTKTCLLVSSVDLELEIKNSLIDQMWLSACRSNQIALFKYTT